VKQFIDRWLRKFLFPKRVGRYADEPDYALKHKVDSEKSSLERANAELELEYRAWVRDFWTRTIVSWLALLISIIALLVAIWSFVKSR
jgi:hypothetical protein